ncbi:MAG: nuclear transport factor 2 family protein [Salinirussus sp.]
MDEQARIELMQGYFEGMDEADADRLRSVFAEDAVYDHLERTARGIDDIVTLLIDERTPQDTVHEVNRWVHDAEVSIAEGVKTGTVEGEPTELPFCDVFEFDADDSAIVHLGVYAR